VTGTVIVVGDPLPDPSSHDAGVYLLRGPDDRRADALRHEPLDGGPRVYEFVVDGLPPGTYFLRACLSHDGSLGCAPYTTDPGGDPSPIRVRAGETTELAVSF